MSRRHPWIAVGAALLLGAGPGRAQEDHPCGNCKTTGRIPVEFDKGLLEAEGAARYCSVLIADEHNNHGIDFLPCPKCKAPSLQAEAQAEYQRLLDDKMAWLKGRREIDAFMDDRRLDLTHVSTAHFDLAWSVPKVKVDKRVLRQHEAAHLYADRLEEVYQQYLDQFHLTHEGKQNGVRHQFMIFELARHSTRAQPKYTGIGGSGASSGTKLMGNISVFVTYWDKTKNRDDEEFHEYIVHNAVHMFLAANDNYAWLGQRAGWVDAGFSHYFTVRIFGRARTHCYQEQDELADWEFDDWEPSVRGRVAAGEIPSFADVLGQHIETLDGTDHLFAWSWVQYLIDGHGPDKWMAFIAQLKRKVPERDALKEVYGMTIFQFLEAWKEFVLDTYRKK